MPEKIDLVICDFDGVITDNRVWVDQDGTETVAAYRSDSIGVKLLRDIGIEVLIPPEAARAEVHRVIYEELCRGRIEPASRTAYRAAIADLVAAGAQGIVLGCTEIGLLIGAVDAPVPVFDTTALHAEAAVTFALTPFRVGSAPEGGAAGPDAPAALDPTFATPARHG